MSAASETSDQSSTRSPALAALDQKLACRRSGEIPSIRSPAWSSQSKVGPWKLHPGFVNVHLKRADWIRLSGQPPLFGRTHGPPRPRRQTRSSRRPVGETADHIESTRAPIENSGAQEGALDEAIWGVRTGGNLKKHLGEQHLYHSASTPLRSVRTPRPPLQIGLCCSDLSDSPTVLLWPWSKPFQIPGLLVVLHAARHGVNTPQP